VLKSVCFKFRNGNVNCVCVVDISRFVVLFLML
jgi:hypothetical protein